MRLVSPPSAKRRLCRQHGHGADQRHGHPRSDGQRQRAVRRAPADAGAYQKRNGQQTADQLYVCRTWPRHFGGRHGPARGVPDARRPPARYCRRRNPNRRCIHRRAKQRHDGQLHGQGRKIGLRFAGLRLPGRAVREKGHCYHRRVGAVSALRLVDPGNLRGLRRRRGRHR